MPMPRLLKRFSEKSLRKRVSSTDSTSSTDRSISEPVPPLPPPKDTQFDDSFRVVTPHSTLKTLGRHSTPSLPTNGDEFSDGKPRSNGRASTLPGPVSSAHYARNAHGALSDEFAAVWNVASNDPVVSNTDKVLQTIEGEALVAPIKESATAVISGVRTALDENGGMQAIEQGVNHFLEGSAILLKALDEVSKLHPFIGVAVIAFKAVYTLEIKRRENDKKIIALHVEMKDMMAALLQLRNVKDVEEVAPDGSSIKDRMEVLSLETANDIKACANACDTYSKKRLLVRVLKAPVWENRLLNFVGLFTKRRSEFQFALTIHTSLSVDAMGKTLGDVDKTTEEMKEKIDLMMQMFQRFIPPEEKEMAALVDRKGGIRVCQTSDKLLRELSGFEQSTGSSPTGVSRTGRTSGKKTNHKPSGFEDLKEDLHVDLEKAIEQNMIKFSRKFDIQKRQIEELSRSVKREGDRVISAVTAGPHEKILDPDVHKIWKEMGWRGSVKARHFVLALRDYFQEKWDSDVQPVAGDMAHALDRRPSDEWALAYLDVVKLQPISEAFDDDASGFVTVAEANAFTTARPLGWSLPHWLAYWAIGWHQSIADYASKINDIFAKMFAILPTIRSENQVSVNNYLIGVYEGVTTLSSSVAPCYADNKLQARFKTYVEAEEARLKGNLDAFRYDIDAENALALVTGSGRIEKFVLPLLYLLLKRHLEIFRICRHQMISGDELPDAVGTINYVLDAVIARVDSLRSLFKQQKLDEKQQFQTFAHGLFACWDEPKLLWDPETVRLRDFPEYTYEEDKEEGKVQIEEILNHVFESDEVDLNAYDILSPDPPALYFEVPSPLRHTLGVWNGYVYLTPSDEFSVAGMISMKLCPSMQGGQDRRFLATGKSNGLDFTVSGECNATEQGNIIQVTFKREFLSNNPTQYWNGRLDVATDTMTGIWGFDPDRATQQAMFVLKRTPPEHLCFRPSPVAFEANVAHALWSFALSAVRHHVRQQAWSWSFFGERRMNRKRFIELHTRRIKFGRPLDEQTEYTELCKLRQAFTSADSQFYHSLARQKIKKTTDHGAICDHCQGLIGGARIICLVCQSTDTWNTVDFCEAPDCVVATVAREDLARLHLPTHDVVKARRVVHVRQFGKLHREATAALKNARAIFEYNPIQELAANASNSFPEAILAAQNRISMRVRAGPACALCKRRVTQPCWYCVQCQDDTFICNDCDSNGEATFRDHDGTHDLVRCQELIEEIDTSTEGRLANLEERLGQLESKVEEGLEGVKKLLESLLGKLGVEPM